MQPMDRRVRFNSTTGNVLRVHYSDERGIVEYRSAAEASMDLDGVVVRKSDKNLPEGVERIEYVDNPLRALYRAMGWGQLR